MVINNQNNLLFSSFLPSLPSLVPPHLLTSSSSSSPHHGFDFSTHTHNSNNNNSINVLHPPSLNQYQISFGGGGDQQHSCTSSDISYNNNNNQGFLYGGLEEMSTHHDDQDIKVAENLVVSYGEAPHPPPLPPLEYSYEEMKNLMSPLDYSSYVDDNEGGFKNQERGGVVYHF